MSEGTTSGKARLENARIVQASVMDETSVMVNFSNGCSALVSSEEIKKLVSSSGAKILSQDEVCD